MIDKPSWLLIIVLIYRINPFFILLCNLPALDIVGRWTMEWTYSTYYFNFRMLLLESLADHQIALFEIGGNQIFVSDTYHLEIERSRMSGIRSHLCPLRCGRITIRPLNQVENILHILWHFCHWDSALLSADALRIRLGILTRYTSSQYWQRLSAHILTPLEILEESQLTGLVIVPDIESRFSVFQFTDTLLPMIDVAESLSVEHTSTWKTYEARLQLSDGLSKILSQTMTFVGILRHQAHHIYGYLFLSLRQEGKTGILAQFTFIFICDDKLRFVFSPIRSLHLQLSLGYRKSFLIYECYCELLFLAVDTTGIQTHFVSSTTLDDDSLPSYIINRCR